MRFIRKAAKAIAIILGGASLIYLTLVVAGTLWLWNSAKKVALPHAGVSSGESLSRDASSAPTAASQLSASSAPNAQGQRSALAQLKESPSSYAAEAVLASETRSAALSETDHAKVASVFQSLTFAERLEREGSNFDPCQAVCQASELARLSGSERGLAALQTFYESRGPSAFQDPRFVSGVRILSAMARMFPSSVRELASEAVAMESSGNETPFSQQLWLTTRLATEIPAWSMNLKRNSKSLEVELKRSARLLEMNKKCLDGEISEAEAQRICQADMAKP
jgi:hypothetical protein